MQTQKKIIKTTSKYTFSANRMIDYVHTTDPNRFVNKVPADFGVCDDSPGCQRDTPGIGWFPALASVVVDVGVLIAILVLYAGMLIL